MLIIFLAVAYQIETKGLSCLTFLEFQPLEKMVAYKCVCFSHFIVNYSRSWFQVPHQISATARISLQQLEYLSEAWIPSFSYLFQISIVLNFLLKNNRAHISTAINFRL